MKATVKTSIMLMAMTIGTLAASAQSARRGTPHNEQKRKTSQSVSSRSHQESVKRNQNTRSTKHVTSRTNSRKSEAYRGNGKSRKQVNTRNSRAKESTYRSANNNRRTVQQSTQPRVEPRNNRKSSVSTRHNPRSDYRAPKRTVNVGKTHRDPKYDNSGKSHVVRSNTGRSTVHKHHYPKTSVKVHVHSATHHNHYKAMYYPAHRDIIWTRRMHRHYVDLYPGYVWRYPVGYSIRTISVFDARFNIGEVSRVYGRVYATWYNRDSDDLMLFFGGQYPHQEFTMIIPGNIARRYSWRPERYFLGQHVFATGLITSFEGNPEMIVKKKYQLDVY